MSKESLTLNMPPLHFLSSQPGGLGKEATTFYKQLASLQHHNELAEMHPIILPASILYTMHLLCTLLDWPIFQSSLTS